MTFTIRQSTGYDACSLSSFARSIPLSSFSASTFLCFSLRFCSVIGPTEARPKSLRTGIYCMKLIQKVMLRKPRTIIGFQLDKGAMWTHELTSLRLLAANCASSARRYGPWLDATDVGVVWLTESELFRGRNSFNFPLCLAHVTCMDIPNARN